MGSEMCIRDSNCNKLIDFQFICKVGSTYKNIRWGDKDISEKVIRTFATIDDKPGVFKIKIKEKDGEMIESVEKIANTPEKCVILNDNITNENTPNWLDRSYYIDMAKKRIEDYLGKDKYRYDLAGTKPEVGLVTGLAWTSVGGVTLTVEVNVLPGKGQVVLTGKLGDVMKESAQAAISYIRSIADKFDIDPDFYQKKDIHIHLPEGATPKDGPSAGITMALAVISALTKIPVRNDVAMTGEITLRGRVLAVGGVREKLLAAHRAGIKKVLLPKECEADLDEIPENIKEQMEFVLVENMDQVLDEALVRNGDK